jgi:hypothetical protein
MTSQAMFDKLNEGKWHTLQFPIYIFITTINHTWAMTYVRYENEVVPQKFAMKMGQLKNSNSQSKWVLQTQNMNSISIG